jgi:GTPase SAR1 family protein
MIEAQKRVVDTCEAVSQKVVDAAVAEAIGNGITGLTGVAKDCQLVAPVIGAFSAGKSSLINSLLGSNILPVGITPETSLATELHYSGNNYIEAVKEDGSTERYETGDIKKMSENAAKYIYARAYLNNPRLKEIEPLVLVDMPGFDSPLDAHNKAIMAYLERGCYYIVLSSVEEGTISASLKRRLQEIDALGRDFSLFLTKSNLRTKDEVTQLVAHYSGQLSDLFAKNTPVEALDNKSVNAVMTCIKNVDANCVFLSLFRDKLIDCCQEIITAINLKISASKKDADTIRAAIKEMQDSIEKLKSKAASETDDMWRRYSGGMINDIVGDVGKALDNAVDELVGVAMTGKQEAVSERLNEIVRSALTITIKENLGTVSQQINSDFSHSLAGLDKVMRDLEIDDNYIQGLSDRVKNAFTGFQGFLATDKSADIKSPALATGYKAVTGLLAATTAIVAPWIEVVVIFFPEIIKLFSLLLGGGQQEKPKEAVRNKLAGEAFPAIKRKLRAEIPQHLEAQVKVMIDSVRSQYEEQIKVQSEIINAQIAEKSTGAAEAETKRAKLETIRAEVQGITNEVLGWGK